MQAVEFEGQTHVLGKDQDEYLDLPAKIGLTENVEFTTCWKMTDEEFEIFKKTRKVYMTQLTFGKPYQPVRMGVIQD